MSAATIEPAGATHPHRVIPPGHSRLLALVSDPGAVKIREALARADAIVESAIDSVVADDIKAAAKAQQADG